MEPEDLQEDFNCQRCGAEGIAPPLDGICWQCRDDADAEEEDV